MHFPKSATFATTFFSLIFRCACSDSIAETVILQPPNTPHTVIDIEVEILREYSRSDGHVETVRAITPIRFEVLEDAMQRMVIGYTSGKPTSLDVELDASSQEIIDSVASITANRTWELVFDKHFSIESLRNFDEATRAVEKLIKLTKNRLSKNAPSSQASVELEKQLTNPKSVVRAMTKVPEMYFRIYGYEFVPGKKRVEAGEVPNLFNNEMIPSTATIELLPFETEDKFYEVHFMQQLDKAESEEKVKSLVEKFMGAESQIEDRLRGLSIQEEGKYYINRKTSWVESATLKRILKIPNQGSRIETYSFRIKE